MSKLFFYYSSMNAGKTTALLQASRNYIECGMNTLLLKPSIDNREGVDAVIKSRINLEASATLLSPEDSPYSIVWKENAARGSSKRIDCVLVDEAQFLTKKQVYSLTRIVDTLHIPVLCYGLRTDFQGNLFPGSQWLLAWAEELNEIKTMCRCRRKATFVLRYDSSGKVIAKGDQVEVGGNDIYTSVCRACFKDKWPEGVQSWLC